jgi:hypothetical protein
MSRMGSKADVLASQNDVSSGSHSRHGSTERQDEECLLTPSLSFRDCGNRLICPLQGKSKSGHWSCGKLTRRANHFRFSEIVSSPEIKNIPLLPPGKSALRLPPSCTHKRGASRSLRTLGAGCGGRGSVRRAIASRTNDAEAYGQVVSF